MFVLSGPLGSLPPQVLLTRKPPETVTYMGAEWLIKTNAVSVVPSVSSFVAIRSASHTKLVVKKNVRYLGLGNPSLDGNPSCGKVELPKTCKQLVEASLKKTIDSRPSRFDYLPGSYFRGNIANLDKVRKICPLPETEREIECVGQDLGASHKDFLVRSRLTETNLKRMRLEDYRIIHFATHGLLAEETHDLSGLSPEPALVMTPPASPTD